MNTKDESTLCARCGAPDKMTSSPWCGYCWHIETSPSDEEELAKERAMDFEEREFIRTQT